MRGDSQGLSGLVENLHLGFNQNDDFNESH